MITPIERWAIDKETGAYKHVYITRDAVYIDGVLELEFVSGTDSDSISETYRRPAWI